jgi:hypothetical protein
VNDIGAAGYDTALKIDIFSGFDTAEDADGIAFTELGLRNVTVSIYDNPDELECIDDEESYDAWCASRPSPRFEIKIPYIPSNATLTIDGRSNRVFMSCDGKCTPFPYQIDTARGKLFPLVTSCAPMVACVEWDKSNTQLKTGAGKSRSVATIAKYRRWLS